MIRELRSLDPEIRDSTGLSPLHVAATMPHSAALRAMLDVFYQRRAGTSQRHEHRTYDVNHVSDAGDSALHICCVEGDADKVRTMLRRGADLEKRGSNSYTLLHRLVQVCHPLQLGTVNSAGLMPTEARGNYLPEAPYLRETKTVRPI